MLVRVTVSGHLSCLSVTMAEISSLVLAEGLPSLGLGPLNTPDRAVSSAQYDRRRRGDGDRLGLSSSARFPSFSVLFPSFSIVSSLAWFSWVSISVAASDRECSSLFAIICSIPSTPSGSSMVTEGGIYRGGGEEEEEDEEEREEEEEEGREGVSSRLMPACSLTAAATARLASSSLST